MVVGGDAALAVCPGNTQTTLFFGNGISSTRDEAQGYLDKILLPAVSQKLGTSVDPSCITSWLAYDARFVDSNNNILTAAN